MIEIQIDDSTEQNDSFNSRYTYINDLYFLKNEKLDLCDTNNYEKYEHNYCDNKTTLESIIDLGNQLISKYKLNNVNDLYKVKIDELITEWLLINPNPYSYFFINNKSSIINFAKTCVIYSTVYDIHKWLIKIWNNIDEISTAPKISKELEHLEIDLNFINFENHIKTKYNIGVKFEELKINIIDIYKNVKNEIIEKLELFKNRNFNDKTSQEYCKFIIDFILEIVQSCIPIIEEPHFVEKKIIFEDDISQYRLKESADSIIELACNELIHILTSKTVEGKTICKNPDCNNEFDSKYGQEFCKAVRCQKYRKNKKSKDWYDLHKKKGTNKN